MSVTSRRRIRRWIFWCTLPVTLAALLLVGKIASMYAFAHHSVSAYVVGDHAGSTQAAQGQQFWNWFEPHLAPFNEGVGLGASGKLPQAEAKFEEALSLASGMEVCDIRVNLALVLEWQGDAATSAREPARAAEFYARAMTVTVETPEECGEPEAQEQTSDPQRDLGDTLEQLKDRLQTKQKPEEQPPPPGQPEESDDQQAPQPLPDQQKLDDLQKKLEDGAREREEQQQGGGGDPTDGSGGQPGDGGSNGTDRPW